MNRPFYQDECVTLYRGDSAMMDPWPRMPMLTDPPLDWEPFKETGHPASVMLNATVLHAWPAPHSVTTWRRRTDTIAGSTFDLMFHYGWVCHLARVDERLVEPETGHGAERSIEAVTRILREMPGNTVFDPFAGSGSVLVAAKRLGKAAIGIEIDEHWCEVIAERCSGI